MGLLLLLLQLHCETTRVDSSRLTVLRIIDCFILNQACAHHLTTSKHRISKRSLGWFNAAYNITKRPCGPHTNSNK